MVGIVVDQMRWDYLYRFYSRYAPNGGFKRLLNQGFSCENTLIPYTPTVTACGHAGIYTGSVPAIHGITGNTITVQRGHRPHARQDHRGIDESIDQPHAFEAHITRHAGGKRYNDQPQCPDSTEGDAR